MKHFILKHLFLFCMQFLGLSLLAQKHFTLTIKLPQTIIPEKIEAFLDNGKETEKIKPEVLRKKEIVFTGDYYSTYAVITLQYPPDSFANGFAQNFFIGEKQATIAFDIS